MRVLLTNDDSHKSPLLEYVITYLRERVDLTFVLPAHEQSWRGKSITRFNPLHVRELEMFGVHGWTVDGTPADCINIGVHNLLKPRPDLVVSGINAGRNAGLAFILSSGTVGACFEANIAGIGAVALSQEFVAAEHAHYVSEYALSEGAREHLSDQTPKCLEAVFSRVLGNAEIFNEPLTLNANFPYFLHEDVPLRAATLGETYYHRLFCEKDGRFVHDLTECTTDMSEDSEFRVIESGAIAVTSLDIRSLRGEVFPPLLQNFLSQV